MQGLKNIIVTGSNKGIGLGIVSHLASKPGWNIIMACRNLELANQAKNEVHTKFPNANLHAEQLDISKSASIDAFLKMFSQKYSSAHVLVNNAGVLARDKFDVESTRWTFATNYYGTVELIEKSLPLIAHHGKIVTLGSTLGRVSFGNITKEDLKQRWKDAVQSKEKISGLLEEFVEGHAKGDFAQKGWPKQTYGISKLGIMSFHQTLSKYPEVQQKKIQVSVCCPGYVNTDMTQHQGVLSIEEGIKTPVFLIEQPQEFKEEMQGGFFYEGKLQSIYHQ